MAFQRRYVSYIKRCDELERKLRYIKGELTKFGLDTEVRTVSKGRRFSLPPNRLSKPHFLLCPVVQVPEGFQRFLGTSSGPQKDQRSGAYVLEQLEVSTPCKL